MAPTDLRSEIALVAAVMAGDADAAKRFLTTISPFLWSIVVKLEGPDAEAGFLHVIGSLKEDGYARLQAFDGRARLSTYVALVARDILAHRLIRAFAEAPHATWNRFERFFGDDFRRRVAQRFLAMPPRVKTPIRRFV
jgi:RNA polymerase primary sigma factor